MSDNMESNEKVPVDESTQEKERGQAENAKEDSLRSEWKGVGKGLGQTFSKLGKSLVKTARVGLQAADDWAEGRDTDRRDQKEELKEGWKDFGRTFAGTTEDLGKTGIKSVKKGVDAIDPDSPGKDSNEV